MGITNKPIMKNTQETHTHSLPVYYSLEISLKSMGQRDAQKQTHEFTLKIY